MNDRVKKYNVPKLTILYLYTEVQGYTIATINSLIDNGAMVHLVCWDDKNNTPFEALSNDSLRIYKRSELSFLELISLEKKINPDITYISGWQDLGYLIVALSQRLNFKTVVVGFDDQWHGTIKQYVASFLGFFRIFKFFYSHAWVCGAYQYEYARKIGFKRKEVIFDLLSADLDFSSVKNYQKSNRFIYIGRFSSEKGIDTLLESWKMIGDDRLDWELLLVGAMSEDDIRSASINGVKVIEFLNKKELIKELSNSSCAIVPSHWDQWGVVVHEFALAGLPIVISDTVGARAHFSIDGYNGYHFSAGSASSLKEQLKKIIDLSDDELNKMSQASKLLSARITPNSSAANLLSLAKHVE
jgi:glycosyltransferase involved in cell wall biosynthesis